MPVMIIIVIGILGFIVPNCHSWPGPLAKKKNRESTRLKKSFLFCVVLCVCVSFVFCHTTPFPKQKRAASKKPRKKSKRERRRHEKLPALACSFLPFLISSQTNPRKR